MCVPNGHTGFMGGPKDLPIYFCEHYTMIQCITSTSKIVVGNSRLPKVGTGLSLRLYVWKGTSSLRRLSETAVTGSLSETQEVGSVAQGSR